MEFHHIALNCRNQSVIEKFYTDYFGFKRVRAFDIGGGQQIIFLKGSGVYLELFQSDAQLAPGLTLAAAEKDGRAYPSVVRHFAFKVDNVDAKLKEMGPAANPATLGPMSFDAFIPGWRSVWLADPEGNIVEISQGFTD